MKKTFNFFLVAYIFLQLYNCESQKNKDEKNNNENIESESLIKEKEVWYVNFIDGVYIRKHPTVKSDPITYLKNNQRIEVIGKSNIEDIVNNKKGNWFLVKPDYNTKGWIFSAYLAKGKINLHIKNEMIDKSALNYTDVFFSNYPSLEIYSEPNHQSLSQKIDGWGPDLIKLEEITSIQSINRFQLGNWIKVKYKDMTGYVLSTEIKLFNGECSRFDKTYDLSDTSWILNTKPGDIVNNERWKLFKHGSNYQNYENFSSSLILNENKYYLILFKSLDLCQQDNHMGLVKILALKEIKYNSFLEKIQLQEPNSGLTCENGTIWEEEIFVVTSKNTINGKYNISSSYRINLTTEKIEKINFHNIICYEYCEKNDCD
ncbi:SH3 domain-containing protein [Leptospira idonii]|nr:SH3 domain-containing protein [Leptospira idonii]